MLMLFRAIATPIEGFKYEPELISSDAERELVREIERLTFRRVVFRGAEALRRVVQYGWDYEFGSRTATLGHPIPPFLLPLRDRAAKVAQLKPEQLEDALVTEYQPGAGIGWHRDAPPFGVVVGISLLSSCKFRLRRIGSTPTR